MNSPVACYLLAAAIAAGCFLLLFRAISSIKSISFLLAGVFRWAEGFIQSYQTFTIWRHVDDSPENPLYMKAAAYVAALSSAEDSHHTSFFSLPSRQNDFFIHLVPGQTVIDLFLGARVSWTYHPSDQEAVVLRLLRRDRRRVLRPYLRHVEAVSKEIGLRGHEIKLYLNDGDSAEGGVRTWRTMTMSHPATFESVVMDQDKKGRALADLELFLKGRAYHARLGRAWRRSYLLYGPAGTGKTSFAAAMARFLSYDLYVVDLVRVSGAGDLRSVLLDTTPRSVILFEDIDIYLRAGKAQISGLINFIDGVFFYCGEERIMVFTAGGEDELTWIEPLVGQAGRIDMKIHFPRCDFPAFKTMARSYLRVTEHKLFADVEKEFNNGGKLSHAELGEILMANRGSTSRAIKNVISALQRSCISLMSSTEAGEKKGCRDKVNEGEGRETRKMYGLIRMPSWGRKERRMLADN